MRRKPKPVRDANLTRVPRPAALALAMAAVVLWPRSSPAQEAAEGAAPDSVTVPSTPGLVVPSGGSVDEAARAASDTITMEEATRIALSRSPAIREAEGSWLASRAAPWESWGRLVPSFSKSSRSSTSQC